MAQAEHQSNHSEKAERKLSNALDRLTNHAEDRGGQQQGLSGDFTTKVKSEADAMAMCEKSMERLAIEYVRYLEAFRDTASSVDALHYLEQAEGIWQTETKVINAFDADSSQAEFFQQMREACLKVLEDRLYIAADRCSHDANAENVALCIGILGLMDQIWGEMGFPPSHPEREKFRQIAQGFKD